MLLNIILIVKKRLITSDTQRRNISRMRSNVRMNITNKIVSSSGFVLSFSHSIYNHIEKYRNQLQFCGSILSIKSHRTSHDSRASHCVNYSA